MKAKENITPKRKEVQAPAAPQRLTARLVAQTFNRIATEMESLANSTHAKTQRQAAILGLFSTINAAKAALLQLTGAPGITTQDELREACEAGGDYSEDGRHRPEFSALHDQLNRKFDAGFLVEPGDYYQERDRQGVCCLSSKSDDREIREYFKACTEARRSARLQAVQPDGMKVETPTPAQLQALYDLPSEPRQAEGSPSES